MPSNWLHPRVIVVAGTGPAGLAAAYAASRYRDTVILLEATNRPGAKLLVSGSGKCNVTNILAGEEFVEKFGRNGRFGLPALNLFPPVTFRNFLQENGTPTEVTDGFHVFPVSRRAADVLQAFQRALNDNGVTLLTGARLSRALIANGGIRGAELIDGRRFHCDALIVATGGKSYPQLGTRGDGYQIAAAAGHTIVEPVPALVGLRVCESWAGECRGVLLEDAGVTFAEKKLRFLKGRGNLVFTHEGMNGPATLPLSGAVARYLLSVPAGVEMKLKFHAGMSMEKYRSDFDNYVQHQGRKGVMSFLKQYLPQVLAEVIAMKSDVDAGTRCARLDAPRRERMLQLLDAVPLTVIGTDSWPKAMVTSGGISLKEVNPFTMESRIVKNLFFAGEVLDLDGPCGGYNIQWAASSGYLAGSSACKKSGKEK